MAVEYASIPDGVSVDITIDPKGSLTGQPIAPSGRPSALDYRPGSSDAPVDAERGEPRRIGAVTGHAQTDRWTQAEGMSGMS